MGTVKTSGPVKAAPSFLPDAEVANLHTNAVSLCDAVTSVADLVVAKLDASRPCPQSVLRFRLLLERAVDVLGKLRKVVDDRLKKFHDAGGAFAAGKVAITFPMSSTRRTKWKEEAIRLAARVAELEGKEFDADAYVKEITEATVPSISHSVELVESA
jgi:hypothetical protein